MKRGIARRSRRVVAPRWVGAPLPVRMVIQPLLDRASQPGLAKALEPARQEDTPLKTVQPDSRP